MTNEPLTKKGLGQHWLHDTASLEAICDAAEVKSGDVVLEIGPGTGTLTTKLVERGARVTALEFDESLVPELRKKFGENVKVEQGDIRSYNFTVLQEPYKIVANIPYYLSANLLRILTESLHKPAVAALLVQKEVAERVAAKPGQMSLISVIAQFYYEVGLGAEVPAILFTPPPKVDSLVLVLKKRNEPLFDVDTKQFFQLVKAGFAARRKTLLNSLSGGLRLGKSEVTSLLASSGISPQARPQELSLHEWQALYEAGQKYL